MTTLPASAPSIRPAPVVGFVGLKVPGILPDGREIAITLVVEREGAGPIRRVVGAFLAPEAPRVWSGNDSKPLWGKK